MRERYGKYEPLVLPVEKIETKEGLVRAYQWVIEQILARKVSPRAVGPVMSGLKLIQELLASLGRLEPEPEPEPPHPFDLFLDQPENRDVRDRYVAWLKSKVNAEGNAASEVKK